MSDLKEMPRREGYWHSKFEPRLPMPLAGIAVWPGQEVFLSQLKAIEEHWLKAHTEAVIAYDEELAVYHERWVEFPSSERPPRPKYPKEQQVCGYRGSSTCRICGIRNGYREFNIAGWQWPSGFRHYIEAHNVRPSLAFQEFIIGDWIK
jgi:hypothetical protein